MTDERTSAHNPNPSPFRRRLVGGLRPAEVLQVVADYRDALSSTHAELLEARAMLSQREQELEAARLAAADSVAQTLLLRAAEQAGRIIDDAEVRAANVRSAAEADMRATAREVESLLEVKGRLRREVGELQASLDAADPAEGYGLEGSKTVQLIASPIDDLGALAELEHDLCALEPVEDVYVREFADERALVEVTVEGGASLVHTLTSDFDRPFALREAGSETIVIELLPAAERRSSLELI